MPRAAQQERAAPKVVEYFVLDKDATSINGTKLQKDQKKIELTEEQAQFYLASGTISTEDPAKDAAAAEAIEQHNAGEQQPTEQQPVEHYEEQHA